VEVETSKHSFKKSIDIPQVLKKLQKAFTFKLYNAVHETAVSQTLRLFRHLKTKKKDKIFSSFGTKNRTM